MSARSWIGEFETPSIGALPLFKPTTFGNGQGEGQKDSK
jgi:hypothetical protein